MRSAIVIFFLALSFILTINFVSCDGQEPIEINAEFGRAWLNSLSSQPEILEKNEPRIWDYNSVPKGYKVVNGTLVKDNTIKTSYSGGAGWLWMSEWSEPIILDDSMVNPLNSLSPFYSDDPWVLAQHYGRPVAVVGDYWDDYGKKKTENGN